MACSVSKPESSENRLCSVNVQTEVKGRTGLGVEERVVFLFLQGKFYLLHELEDQLVSPH